MLPKFLILVLGLPFALFCCLLVPLVFITVFACSPFVLAYRYAVGPLKISNDDGAASGIAPHPAA